MRKQVRSAMTSLAAAEVSQVMPFTEDLEEVFRRAQDLASKTGEMISARHLLFGVVEHGKGTGYGALATLVGNPRAWTAAMS
ncbi:MAG TPA: hypothetical protein VI248_18785 [Kineosporiaceae bacterium]